MVEDISRRRTPHSSLEAIYFLTADEYTVSRLIEDYAGKQPMYAGAHVFFTSVLADELFQRIKRSPASGYIKTLREMNVDFLVAESQVFTLDQPLSLHHIFNPSRDSTQQPELERIAQRLVSVFATLGELPYIRYYDPDASKSSVAYRLALAVNAALESYCRLDPDFPPPSEHKRAVLIISDRTLDVLAPLLHEFTYQAMAADLLEMDGNKYAFKNESDGQMNSVTLDESDAIWVGVCMCACMRACMYVSSSLPRMTPHTLCPMWQCSQHHVTHTYVRLCCATGTLRMPSSTFGRISTNSCPRTRPPPPPWGEGRRGQSSTTSKTSKTPCPPFPSSRR